MTQNQILTSGIAMEPARKKIGTPEAPGPEPEIPAVMLELKRRAAERGFTIHLATPGADWSDREPIDVGESASDIVIRNRGKEP